MPTGKIPEAPELVAITDKMLGPNGVHYRGVPLYSQNCHVSVCKQWVNWSEVQVAVASVGIPVNDYRGSSQNYWVMLYYL